MEVENKYYQIYVDGNIDLASSIVLKCEDAAKSLNQWVLAFTNASFDETDPRTWKYYKNICGEYFQSDEVMFVRSLDSLEEIEFSKTNLEFHRATKKAYAFGTTYYKELVERYPKQEQIIRGILYPADMQEAIAAYDGQILAYPPSLVEETETSLIPRLQEWINGFYRRWHNLQYGNTDNLYLASMLGVLYSQMPAAIENIRLAACFTHEVHSYHIQQYLASHSKLDKYMPYLTRSQAMYFYHNLAYIENNNGREEIFEELLKRTFTERDLPMGHFSLMHSVEGMPESLTPTVVFEKTPLNTPGNIDNKNQFTLNEVLNIEDGLHPGNIPYREEEQLKIEEKATYTLNPNVPTKLLQSTVIDYTDSEKYRFFDILLQHWVWFAHKNLYKAFISFVLPTTGARLSLTPMDAFAFYAYALCKGVDMTLDNLPQVICRRVQRLPNAELESLREVCEKRWVSDEWLSEVRAAMPVPPAMISVEAFRGHCHELFLTANNQFSLTALEERMTARGQKEAAVARLWGDESIYIGDYPNQNYADWFTDRNIVVKDLTSAQLFEISQIILKEATGENLSSTITLKDIQRAMRDLLVDLSSYSIQVDLNINPGPVLQIGFVQVRPDDVDIEGGQQMYVPIPTVDVENVITKGFQSLTWDVNEDPTMKIVEARSSRFQKAEINPVAFVMPKKQAITISRRYAIGVGFKTIVDLQAPNPRGLTIVPGMERFLELPLETQLACYVDTWAK